MFARILLLFLVVTFISACAYNYEMGVPKDASPSEYATMTFHNNYKVSEIDGKIFSSKLSVWNEGSHTIKMLPGEHVFKVSYISTTGAETMTGWTYSHTISVPSDTLTVNMEAGKSYEIISDIGVGSDNKVRYKIVEIF